MRNRTSDLQISFFNALLLSFRLYDEQGFHMVNLWHAFFFLFIEHSFFFQARLMDVVFILLETLNTLLDTLGVVVMEGATCILPRFSWGSIVLEILQ